MASNSQEYVKSIKLTFNADMKSLNYVREQIKRQTSDKGAIEDAIKTVSASEATSENIATLKKLREKLDELNTTKTAKNVLDSKNKVKSEITSFFVNTFKDIASKVGDFFLNEMKAAIEELQSIASYDLTTSSTYSSNAWSMLKEYGVTGSDAYALQKSMSDIGVSSQDELMEALMQPNVANRFAERMAYWQDNYSDAQETGKAINDFILEWQDFKEELMMDFVDWFADNKDSIKTALKFGITVLEGLAKIIGDIVAFFVGTTDSSTVSASDIVQNYSTVSSNTTNNKVDITVNGSNSTAIGQNVYSYLQTKLGIK